MEKLKCTNYKRKKKNETENKECRNKRGFNARKKVKRKEKRKGDLT